LKNGSTKAYVLRNDKVLVIERQSADEDIILLINFSNDITQVVDLMNQLSGTTEAIVLLASVGSGITWG
jgi:hypothetical protein